MLTNPKSSGRILMYVVLTAFLLVFAGSSLIADDKAQSAEKTQYLYSFLGKWEGKGTIVHEGQTSECTIKREGTKTADGNGVLISEIIQIPGMSDFKSTSLIGFESGHDHVNMLTTSSHGTADHYGYWIDENNYEVKYEGLRDGKIYIEMVDFKFNGKNIYTYSTVSYIGTNKVGTLNAELKKVSM